jgi:hypothetical protein
MQNLMFLNLILCYLQSASEDEDEKDKSESEEEVKPPAPKKKAPAKKPAPKKLKATVCDSNHLIHDFLTYNLILV